MGWKKVDPIKFPNIDTVCLNALNDTTAAAAIYAKQHHEGWKNRTGTAEGSIRFDPAKKVGPTRYRGLFGSFDVRYFIFLELGHHTRSGSWWQGDHTLRRAADATFPSLGARLKARFGRAA